MKQKYYVVWEGASEGVFSSWEACQEAVKGFPGARYKSYKTLEEAEEAFYGNPSGTPSQPPRGEESMVSTECSGTFKPSNVTLTSSPRGGREGVEPSNVTLTSSPRGGREGVAVDAACSGNPGPMEYRGVYLPTGKEIFHYGPVHGTNNIGEFLAIVHGLALLKKKGLHTMPIYSDSVNAQLWVRRKKCKTTLVRDERTEELYGMIERAEHWLRTNQYTNPILKWETDKWGEIPADFGRK